MVKNAEYYMEHTEEFDALSEDEKAAIYLEHGDITEDSPASTGDEPPADLAKGGEEPQPETAKDEVSKGEHDVAADEGEPAAIQAKDGKNVIPYSELEKAREDAARWKKAAVEPYVPKMPEDTPPDVAEKYAGKLADLEQRFENGDLELKDLLKERDAINAAITRDTYNWQIEQDQKARAAAQEEAAARSWHEEQAAFRQRPENAAFVGPDGNWAKDSEAVTLLNNEVIAVANSPAGETMTTGEILTEARRRVVLLHPTVFPSEGRKETAEALAKKAEEKIAAAKVKPPASLSEVPGSSAAHHDEAAALLEMSGLALMQKFEGKNMDQIEATLARLL